MLVPFVIDAESIAPDDGWTMAQQLVYHQGLLGTWQRIGVLVHDGPKFENSRIKAAIDALPQKLLPLWQELLERLPIVPGQPEWDGIACKNQNCMDALSASSNVVLLDDAKAEIEFGLEEAELSKVFETHPSLEFCRILAVGQAQTFGRAIALSGQHILQGQTYQNLWQERFQLLAKAPLKRVTIVDRYAVSQYRECPQGRLSGLERFLRLLDADASGKRYVSLFSAWTGELRGVGLEEVQEEVGTALGRLQQGHVKEVKIVMLPNHVFGDLHHDRFIRFEDYVWDIGLGIKVFEGPAAAETSTVAFKAADQVTSYREAERVLSSHREARTIKARR